MSKNSFPLVTIGIPTYNRADSYLEYAVKSAVNQTYPNIEIIVSDNCSNDNTEMVIKAFEDSRIRFFKQNVNIGPNKNFNFCLKQAKGCYFLLLNDDDFIDDDFVDVCMKAADFKHNIGIIRTGTRIIDTEGHILVEYPNRSIGLSTEDFFRGWFTFKTSFFLCSSLFNTKKLKEIGGFQSKHQHLEDAVAIVKLAANYERVDVQEVKANFRKHTDQITYAVNVKHWCEDYLHLLDLICDLSRKNKSQIRNEGERFFALLNYNLAKSIPSRIPRILGYINVFIMFRYKFLPPHLQQFVRQNFFYTFLRNIKHKYFSQFSDTP